MNTLTIRYKYIKLIVNDIYIRLNILKFPIDIIEIISSFNNIKIVSYHQFMLDHNLTKEETFELLNSDEGCTDYFKPLNKYIIYYNDLDYKSEERIRWTLSHELGHILCEHYSKSTKIFCENLTEEDYKFREAEANYFTGLLLSNPVILHKLNIRSSYDIETYCSLSSEAARYRYDNYKKWRKNIILTSSDRYIIRNFQDYLNAQALEYQEFLVFMSSF
ncbi:ImmA/IrrE family metallo-endopeptidase [uncultured Clostridium sp.]|uniref:ImmA/IrrE family metallo-endopeptidase n=1 Tax=uncultured Clostridium sp. TaxID=59620 RepID=UPI0028E1D6E9|nr:ImmA/IrrE family metallo-endopeptidase [uncultured Clostridium sp.]